MSLSRSRDSSLRIEEYFSIKHMIAKLLPGGGLAGVKEPVGLLPVDKVAHRELLAPGHLYARSLAGKR